MSRSLVVDIEEVFATPSLPWRPGLSLGRERTMLASCNPPQAHRYRVQLLTQCIDVREPLLNVTGPEPLSAPTCASAVAPAAKQQRTANAASWPHALTLATVLGLIGLLAIPSHLEASCLPPILLIGSQPASSPPPPSRTPTETGQWHATVPVTAPQPKPSRSATHRTTQPRRVKPVSTHTAKALRASSPRRTVKPRRIKPAHTHAANLRRARTPHHTAQARRIKPASTHSANLRRPNSPHHTSTPRHIKPASDCMAHAQRAHAPYPRNNLKIGTRLKRPRVRVTLSPIRFASFDTMAQQYASPSVIRPAVARPQVDWMSQMTQRRITDDRHFLP